MSNHYCHLMAAKKLEEIKNAPNWSKADANKSKIIRNIKKIIDLNRRDNR